jgi:hypothetical protein
MVAEMPSRLDDGQLELIQYETANWTVRGPQGLISSEVTSLRLAMNVAAIFIDGGHAVVALVRGRTAEIVVFSSQSLKIWDRSSEQEVYPALRYVMNV